MTCQYCHGRGWLIMNGVNIQACDDCEAGLAMNGHDDEAVLKAGAWIEDAEEALRLADKALKASHNYMVEAANTTRDRAYDQACNAHERAIAAVRALVKG